MVCATIIYQAGFPEAVLLVLIRCILFANIGYADRRRGTARVECFYMLFFINHLFFTWGENIFSYFFWFSLQLIFFLNLSLYSNICCIFIFFWFSSVIPSHNIWFWSILILKIFPTVEQQWIFVQFSSGWLMICWFQSVLYFILDWCILKSNCV